MRQTDATSAHILGCGLNSDFQAGRACQAKTNEEFGGWESKIIDDLLQTHQILIIPAEIPGERIKKIHLFFFFFLR